MGQNNKMRRRLFCLMGLMGLCFLLGACGSKTPEYADFEDSYVDTLPRRAEEGLTLHAFNWTYEQIRENLPAIREAGFKNVLTMPVQQPKGGGAAWWAFYQPLSFSIAEKSALGSKEDLIRLCEEAEGYGICILADIVANHMATTDQEEKEADGTPMVSPLVEAYEPWIYANRNQDTDGRGLSFHHRKNATGSGAETQYYAYGNLPDLNTANPYVQERVLSLLKECIDAGVDGFRFDAAKHIETPTDPDYPGDFWEKTLEEAKKYYFEKTGQSLYVYGEILNAPLGRGLEAYTKYMRVTDDGYTAQLKNAFAAKDASLILSARLKSGEARQLVAWVESHDEYVSSNTHYSELRVAKYWAVLATRPELGALYLARPDGALQVGSVGSYAFEGALLGAINRFHNRFLGARVFEQAEGTYLIHERLGEGDQGALILCLEDGDPEKEVVISLPHLENGRYYDAVTGQAVMVHNQEARIRFAIEGMAILTRSPGLCPEYEISQRGGSFADSLEVTISLKNCEEAWYSFNEESERYPISGSARISLKEHLAENQVTLHLEMKNASFTRARHFSYSKIALLPGGFNVINLAPELLDGSYELYIWSWNPSRWHQEYEIRDGVLLVDTAGMTGFLLAVFEKGYVIGDPTRWDARVIKQSMDISGELLEQGFADLSGF